MELSELQKIEKEARMYWDGANCDLNKGYNELNRVINIVDNTSEILDGLDEQFSKNTGLTKKEIVLLFTATCLQMGRQYLLTKFPIRLDDQSAAKQTFGHQTEHSDRHHRYYNPSLEEILNNPVPFDANVGANGALSGGGRMGHRGVTLGHDPILGLFFGTANIATSTLTNTSFESFHISTNIAKRDCFKCPARTDLVLKYTFDKLFNQGIEGKTKIAAALMKEIVHLNSDLNTKNSLPLPFISVVDAKVASRLAEYGLDMANIVTVGKQFTWATLINSFIVMLHGLLYDDTIDRKQYEVRTRKIIMYSSTIASIINVGAVAVTKDLALLDIGGILVEFIHLLQDPKFINGVKEEYIFGNYNSMIIGEYPFSV